MDEKYLTHSVISRILKPICILLVISLSLLAACQPLGAVTIAPNSNYITPSQPPRILTTTPSLRPSIATYTATPVIVETSTLTLTPPIVLPVTLTITPTTTETITPSPTPIEPTTSIPTSTSMPQSMDIKFLGCSTGVDVVHGMGEVTNAYVTIINPTENDQSEVCVTLSSEDEGRVHPDKSQCISSLPGGFMVTIQLTIDTTFKKDPLISLELVSREGSATTIGALLCSAIGDLVPPPEILNVLQPIQ